MDFRNFDSLFALAESLVSPETGADELGRSSLDCFSADPCPTGRPGSPIVMREIESSNESPSQILTIGSLVSIAAWASWLSELLRAMV